MAISRLVCTVEFRLPWWFWLYVSGMRFFCMVMGTEPDFDKVMRTLLWGSRWRMNGGCWRRF
jgi:hypothetical protein